jgi:hypothetical protein
MMTELIIRRGATGQFYVTDSADPSFELNEITDAQLLGYLRHRRLVGTTAEAVIQQFDPEQKRSIVHVTIDRSI